MNRTRINRRRNEWKERREGLLITFFFLSFLTSTELSGEDVAAGVAASALVISLLSSGLERPDLDDIHL